MAIREITLDECWRNGLDFGGFFHHQGLVKAALGEIVSKLPNVVGYCLSFHEVPGGKSWFEPFGGDGLLTDARFDPTKDLPPQVEHDRLLIDTWGWPVLASYIVQDHVPRPPFLPDAVWRGQLRLQNGDPYVGYFKVVRESGNSIPDNVFRVAFGATKTWLDKQVDELRNAARQRDARYSRMLSRTHECILEDTRAGNPRFGLFHLALLLTSHLGAQLNRVAFFVPVLPDILECVYAHGGDGSDEWARIQDFMSHEIKTVDDLHGRFSGHAPVGDPLFEDLVGERINTHSDSLIVQVWQRNLNLDWLNDDQKIQADPFVTLDYAIRHGHTIAGIVRHGDDPWLVEHRVRRASSALFKSMNDQWFLLPWRSGQRALGLVLFDLANWSRWDVGRDLVPRLRQAEALLEHFAPDFLTVSWK